LREEDLMRLLGGLGGVITLIETIIGFNERRIDYSYIILLVVSIVLSLIILLSVIKPGDPVPLNWLLFVGIVANEAELRIIAISKGVAPIDESNST